VVVSASGPAGERFWLTSACRRVVTMAKSRARWRRLPPFVVTGALCRISSIGYALDAVPACEPRGMLGRRFGVDMHMVTADVATARNLMLTVERSHLSVEAMVASPYMAGLAVLADDEADLGAACIDLGAGTTTLAVFSGGRFVHADGFALGGHHITMDLARGLNTRIADAERIKAIYVLRVDRMKGT
jgi:cell division protein FtsA